MVMNNLNSGVCSHSSPNMWQEFIIFEIDDHEQSHEILKLSCDLNGFELVELQGSWEGEVNPSFILPADQFFRTGPVNDTGDRTPSIGALFCSEQDCVLHISKPEKRARAWRDATLLYQNGKVVPIGKFKQVSGSVAKRKQGWTHNPNNGGWWICE